MLRRFWARAESAIWTGDVIRDYGLLSEDLSGLVKQKVSSLLCRRKGKDVFVIRSQFTSYFAASVQFVQVDREAAEKLKVALDDALAVMESSRV